MTRYVLRLISTILSAGTHAIALTNVLARVTAGLGALRWRAIVLLLFLVAAVRRFTLILGHLQHVLLPILGHLLINCLCVLELAEGDHLLQVVLVAITEQLGPDVLARQGECEDVFAGGKVVILVDVLDA